MVCKFVGGFLSSSLVITQDEQIDMSFNFTIHWNFSTTGDQYLQFIVVNIHPVTSSTAEVETLGQPSGTFTLRNNTEYAINVSLCNQESNFHFGMCYKML